MKKVIISLAKTAKKIIKAIFPASWIRAVMNAIYHARARQIIRGRKKKHMVPENPGINLIASITGDSGLGQSSRLIAGVLEKSRVPFSIYNYVYSYSLKMEDTTYADQISSELPYDINLIHINPRELGPALFRLPKSIWNHKYNIAFWLWEQEELPKPWHLYTKLFDEIWTPADFISKAVEKCAPCPVRTLPYHVTAPVDENLTRAHFGLPEDVFLFEFMYDANSVAGRKNPMAVVKAFREAFSPEDMKVGLVIKANNGKAEDMEKLRELLPGYPNLFFLTENMKKVEVNSLLSLVDVFVSLHRAEGFGLGMAEAMLVGTPCIATNWSANTEFMNADVACMVDYGFVTLEKAMDPYPAGSRWADADVSQAAAFMKRLYEDPAYYEEKKTKGYEHIRKVLGLSACVETMESEAARVNQTIRNNA